MKLDINQRVVNSINTILKQDSSIGKTDIAKHLGIKPNNLTEILGSRTMANTEIIAKLCERFNLDAEWILTGNNSMFKSGEDQPLAINNKNLAGYYFPNVNASAGLDVDYINEELDVIPVHIPNFGRDLKFINVFGDSMYPKYQSGEIIGLKEIEYDYIIPGHTYVVTMMNGEVYLKYIKQGKDDDHVILASENSFYEPKQFHKEKIKSFYMVKAVLSKTTI